MYWLVLFLGLAAVIFGAFSLSQATMGAGIIAVGCFLGIFARIIQAQQHHSEATSLAPRASVSMPSTPQSSVSLSEVEREREVARLMKEQSK